MSQDLFRKEVLEARRTGWLGSISLTQPLRLWVLTTFASTAALAIVLFLVFGTYTRRSRVVGQLVPVQGMATVLAPATGIVSRVEIPEGGHARAGETIAVVTMPRATVADGDTLAALEARLQRRTKGLHTTRSAQQEQLDAQASGLSGQRADARRELKQIQTEIATRQTQIRIARETLDRLRGLEEDRYVSLLQIKQQETTVLALTGEMQALQRQLITARRLITQLDQAIRELPGQRLGSEAAFQRDLALLEQEGLETQARSELAVTAPVAGVVATQLFKTGQAVQSGQPLMSILPGDGTLEAELLVPSSAIGFIEAGDVVLLRYHAYPYQKFGRYTGHVTRISRSALTTSEQGSLTGKAETGEQRYHVRVALTRQSVTAYGRAEALKSGMLLEADVLGERRRLIEWLFEPLYSIHGSMSAASTESIGVKANEI